MAAAEESHKAELAALATKAESSEQAAVAAEARAQEQSQALGEEKKKGAALQNELAEAQVSVELSSC